MKNALNDFAVPLFKMGFKLIRYVDEGMGKTGLLDSKWFQVQFNYERGPIECVIIKDNEWLDLIHLINYLNLNSETITKIGFLTYFWDLNGNAKSDELYIKDYVSLLTSNFNTICSFIKASNKADLINFIKYCKNENLNHFKKR